MTTEDRYDRDIDGGIKFAAFVVGIGCIVMVACTCVMLAMLYSMA